MKILIEIPKEFENHFKKDAFEESLHRLSADAHLLAMCLHGLFSDCAWKEISLYSSSVRS